MGLHIPHAGRHMLTCGSTHWSIIGLHIPGLHVIRASTRVRRVYTSPTRTYISLADLHILWVYTSPTRDAGLHIYTLVYNWSTHPGSTRVYTRSAPVALHNHPPRGSTHPRVSTHPPRGSWFMLDREDPEGEQVLPRQVGDSIMPGVFFHEMQTP